MTKFYYTLKPFRVEILIIFSKSVKVGLNYLINECDAKIDVTPDQEKFTCAITGCGRDHLGMKSYFMIFSKKDFNISILAHEVFHAVYRISLEKTVQLCPKSEEYFAYAIEDMVNFILENKDKK
jgi:hypothetical protein